MATTMTQDSDVVADPVSHISISGVHGRHELDERLAHPPRRLDSGIGLRRAVGSVLLGAAAGALLMYLFDRNR